MLRFMRRTAKRIRNPSQSVHMWYWWLLKLAFMYSIIIGAISLSLPQWINVPGYELDNLGVFTPSPAGDVNLGMKSGVSTSNASGTGSLPVGYSGYMAVFGAFSFQVLLMNSFALSFTCLWMICLWYTMGIDRFTLYAKVWYICTGIPLLFLYLFGMIWYTCRAKANLPTSAVSSAAIWTTWFMCFWACVAVLGFFWFWLIFLPASGRSVTSHRRSSAKRRESSKRRYPSSHRSSHHRSSGHRSSHHRSSSHRSAPAPKKSETEMV